MSLKNCWKIVLKESQNLFFMSDPHYGHKNIVKGETLWKTSRKTRDFSSVEDMNDKLTENINSIVKADDILICLGDFAFGGFENIPLFRKRINCKNIYLILGNHDDHIDNDKNGYRSLFLDVSHYKILKVKRENTKKNYMFVLQHFPLASWRDMKEGFIHLFGHLHSSDKDKIMKGKSMDVGMDGNNLLPYSIDEILEKLKYRPVANNTLKNDHHARVSKQENMGPLQRILGCWKMYFNR